MSDSKSLFNIQHMHVTELYKGLSFAPHRHDNCQFYAVLEGEVSYHCDEDNFILKDRDAIIIAPGKLRSLECLSASGRAIISIFNDEITLTENIRYMKMDDYQYATADKLANAIAGKIEPSSIVEMRFNYLAAEMFDIDFSAFSYLDDGSYKACYVAEQLMMSNLETPLKLDDIARLVGISRAGLERAFQKHFNVSVMRKYRILRINAARKMLEKGLSISEAAYLTGFSSPQHFATVFKNETNVTPSSI